MDAEFTKTTLAVQDFTPEETAALLHRVLGWLRGGDDHQDLKQFIIGEAAQIKPQP